MFSLTTCLPSPRETREHCVRANLLFMVRKLFLCEQHCFLCRPAPSSHFKRGNSVFKQNGCSCFEISFVVAKGLPSRPVPAPHFKRESRSFKQHCWSCLGTCFCYETVFPLPTCPSSSPKRGKHLFKHTYCSWYEVLFPVKQMGSYVDLSLLLTSNAGTVCSNNILVHVSKLVDEQVFPLPSCPSSSTEQWDPIAQAQLLFMFRNLCCFVKKCRPCRLAPFSLKTWEPLLQANLLFMI